ncbi:MAG TPA: translocation/assembly module TamB domain-containing protein [Longimicrobiales bacterium]|nr:translocation/assembly module TamB domain-containing protein [Longimicrobiales bacterium]
MSRSLRLAGYIAIGVLSGLLLAAGIIFLLSRTDWGMERVRGFAVSWLEERVDGELRIGRITGPGLLGGVVIHDFGIVDPKGRPFLATDSIELNYNIRTLLGGSVVLNNVVLYGPEIVLEQLPGDTAWNYQYVFPDRTPGEDEPRTRRLILFNDARVVDGTATVRIPIEPGDQIETGDTARIIFDRLQGGLARVMRFEQLNARLDRVIWESPLEPGRLVDIQSLQTRGFVWRDPFIVEDMRGTLTMRDTIVAFDLPEVELPGSRAAVLGSVILEDGRNNIDVRVESSRVALRDLQFLHPQIPEEGGGSVLLRIKSQPDGILFLAEDARLSTPGTSIAGSFGVVTGDTLYFTNVDLRASPLDVQLIERILPGGLPVDGLLVGTVEVRGPLSALETSGDMRLTGSGTGAPSEVAWRGVLDVRNRTVSARSFNADVRHLEMAIVSAFAPELKVTGSVSGTVSGSGGRGRMNFAGLLEHASSDGGRSVFDGGGSLEGGGRSRRLDLTLNASPVTFHDLAQQVPALQGLQGELSGPVHIAGTADDMAFDAELTTPGGPLALDGRVMGRAGARRIAATAEAHGFRLDAFRDGLPPTTVSGTLTVDLTGNTVGTMTGPVRLALDSTRLGELPHSTLLLGAHMSDGLLVVDSAFLRGPLGTGRASGTIALVETAHGTLQAGYTAESLTALEPFLYRNQGPAADGEPRVAGHVDALATITGWVGNLAIESTGTGSGILLGPVAAGRVHAEVNASGLGTDRALYGVVATADSAQAFTHAFQVARLQLAGTADSMHVTAGATAAGEDRLFAAGVVQRVSDDSGATFHARLDEARLGGRSPWLLAAPAAMHIANGTALLDSVVLERDAGGRAVAGGRLTWAPSTIAGVQPLEFTIGITRLPFTDLLGVLNSRTQGSGIVDGSLRVSGSALDPFIEAEVMARDMTYGDVRIDRAYAELNYAALGIDAHAEAQYGGRRIISGGGRIPIDLRLASVGERRLAEQLRLTITADSLPPGLPLGLVDGFTNVRGRIDGMMTVGGTTIDPTLSGGFTIRNGTADWDVSGVRYSDVTGNFVLEQGRLLRVDLSAVSADPRTRSALSFGGTPAVGSGTVKGTLDFDELGDPQFDLQLRAASAYAARRRDVEARVTGAVHMGGRYTRPVISGELHVDQGAIYIEELYRQYLLSGVELDDPTLLSLVDTALVAVRPIIAASRNPFVKNLQVRDLQVDVGADSWLRSRDMDVEVSGRLNVAFRLDPRDEDLRLTGSLAVNRGTYSLYYPPLQSRRFQVRQGSIDFPGTPGIDPNLSITAAYKARARGEPLDVLAIVSGTLQSPRVHLSSEVQPPISESDLASYLFFGVPTWEVAGSSQQNRAMAGLGGALTPSVLGYASSGLQALVQNAGLLDYVGLTTTESGMATEPDAGFSDFLAETQLEIGRYLTSDVYFGMSKRLGTSNLDAGARLEWRFLPEYSFEMFAEDRLARAPAFGLRQETGLRKVYGFLLFREWGF